MKMIFLGTGSAFTIGDGNFQSNVILQKDNGNLLIDCGTDIRFSIAAANLSHRDITDVYISHLHADHAGGLEWLALKTFLDQQAPTPNLYISDKLIQPLWSNLLRAGLSSFQAMEAKLDNFFNCHPIAANGGFKWQGVDFKLIQTVHVMNQFVLSPSFGLLITINNTTIFFTSDTQLAPNQIHDFYRRADIIFNDCETKENPSGVHATYKQLAALDATIKSKMWLYHYEPGELPDATKDGFRGFVKRGQVFEF